MTENNTKKEKKFLLGTDYPIPRFDFKQAIFLMVTLFIIFTVGTAIVENISGGFALPALFIISLAVGYSISFTQFYKKEDAKKSKLIIGGLFSSLAFIMLFSFYYANTIL